MHWIREKGDRDSILPLGPSGYWDSGRIFASQHPLVEGDQIKFYYGAFNVGHHSVVAAADQSGWLRCAKTALRRSTRVFHPMR